MDKNENSVADNDQNTAANAGTDEENVSMEEILKSIKGVISGDEEPSSEESQASEDETYGDDEDVLELTEEVKDDNSNEPESENVETEEESGKDILNEIDDALASNTETDENISNFAINKDFEDSEAEIEKSSQEAVQESDYSTNEKDDDLAHNGASDVGSDIDYNGDKLIKERVAMESSKAIKELVNIIPKSNIDSPYTKGGVTLEELTIEAMKPFLSEWLNENLPAIVKQIVTKEVKKLIPDDDDNEKDKNKLKDF